jgi:hypothetical protein
MANATTYAREDAFDAFTLEEVVRLMRACWGSKWDMLPDDLLPEERRYAADHGALDTECLRRLERKWA